MSNGDPDSFGDPFSPFSISNYKTLKLSNSPIMNILDQDTYAPIYRNGLLVDFQIQELCEVEEDPMIYPYESGQVRARTSESCEVSVEEKIISYGTSSMGYDVRLDRRFKIFTNVFNAVIDPLAMPDNAYVDHEGDYVIIPPNSYVLGSTIEYFKLPNDVGAICVGKSTYARVGCAINVTPIEPGFHGNIVIEISNQTTLPMKVYADMGIAQFLFFRTSHCKTSYSDRNGKYQGQTGIQTALV